jgi:myo-inositol-1(or 4)-monophosphatase
VSDLGAELLALATPIARSVAEHLAASIDREGPQVSTKSSATDLVTELDTWAEREITARLLDARPHDGIIGEEGADVRGTSDVTWCIDPIDGTVNFVHGIPGFCVSIAAQVDGVAVAGVVVSPLHADTFTAVRGGGAHRNDRPIQCASPGPLGRAVVGTGFGYDPDRRRRQAEVVTRVLPQIADIRRGGAAAVDLCWVACGRLDAYWEVGLNPWDHAAGALIATEAGAICAGLDGGPPSDACILAAPAATWAEIAAVLAEAGAGQV